MNSEISLGAWIRRRRRLLDLTQAELANQVGCSPVTIRKLEIDERRPSKQLAERLVQCLDLPREEQAHFLAFARAPSPSFSEDRLGEAWSTERGSARPTLMHSGQADWGEAPDVSSFYGRGAESTVLCRWLLDERCRLVAILGMGGMGKTALAAQVAMRVEHQFAHIVWRSLRNAPPLEELLGQCIQVVSNQKEHTLPDGVDKRIALLMEHLRRQRCLIVFDNIETVLRSDRAGYYLPGYEGYGELIQQVGEGRHQSCLMLTSREKPKELVALEGEAAPVRILALASLLAVDSRTLLQDRGLSGSETDWAALHTRFSGNPLALKVVSETIRELFAGNIAGFLCEETVVLGGIEELLAQQFARLSPLEQEVMLWLAVVREPVEPEALRTYMVQPATKSAVFAVLHSLRQRSLVERMVTGFTLQNVVMEYLTADLIEQVSTEIVSGQPLLFHRYALLIAQAKSYVRDSQRNLILMPIANQLSDRLGKQTVSEQLKTMLSYWRHTQTDQVGYMGGNVLNLLVQLNSDLRGLDFSRLAVWQADLRGANLQDVNFSQANLARSTFTDSFVPLEALVFSPDGERLAVGTMDGEIRLWQVPNGQPLLACTGHTSVVRSIAFSPDGRLLASGSFDQTVRLWDAQTGQCRQTLTGHTGAVWFACFSPDGRIVASGAEDQTIRLWEVSSGRCLSILLGHTHWVTAVCFSPDGTMVVSSSSDQSIGLWDAQSGQRLHTLQGHTSAVTFVCFSPDGTMLASCSADQTIGLWNVRNGQRLHTFQGHTSEVRSVCFSPDGRILASGGFDCTVRLWNLQTYHCFHTLQEHTAAILAVHFSPNGSLLASGSYDQTIRLWDIPSGQCIYTLQGHIGGVGSICFNSSGDTLVSGSADAMIRFWDVQAGQCIHNFAGHTGWVMSVCYSPNDHILASSGSDHIIRLWDAQNGQCLHTLQGHTGMVWSICFSPNGGLLLSSGGEDRTLRLWDVASGQYLYSIEGLGEWVRSSCFHPHGAIVATGDDSGHVYLFDLSSRQCCQTFVGHRTTVWSVCFSLDGRTVASGSTDQTIRLWNVQDGQCLHTLQGHNGWVTAVCFSPDGRLLASGSHDGTVRLWDVQSGQCLHVLQGHTFWVMTLRFSPDGCLLASGSVDATIRLWDVQTRACLHILRGDRPYERMNITNVAGLTSAQIATLKVLGAIEDSKTR